MSFTEISAQRRSTVKTQYTDCIQENKIDTREKGVCNVVTRAGLFIDMKFDMI